MNDAAIGLLQLDPEAVSRAANFYMAYATTCQREREELASADRRFGRPGQRPPSPDVLLMESASAYRKAASWALLVDAAVGAQLLRAASDVFLELNFGYGVFLAALADEATIRTEDFTATPHYWWGQLDFLLSSVARLQEATGERTVDVPEPMRHPQQQVYAVLAAAAGSAGRSRDLALAVRERSGQLAGVLPVGALGTPIRRFWAVASGLLQDDLDVALAHIGAMTDRFADQAESAMSDEALWRDCHAGFEVVDLDIIGLTALTFRRFGRDRVLGTAEEERTFRIPIGRSQMMIAAELDQLLNDDGG